MANEFIVKNGLIVSGSARVSGSITATAFSGSFSGSINTAISASYTATASYLNPLTQNVSVTGNVQASNLVSVADVASGNKIYNNNFYVTNDGSTNIGNGQSVATAKLQIKGSGTTSSTTTLLVQNANASSSFSVLDSGYVRPYYGINFGSDSPSTGNGGVIIPYGNGIALQAYGASSGNNRYGRIEVGNVTATSNFLGYFVGTTIGTNSTVFGATSDGVNSTTYFYFGNNLSNIVASAIVNIDSTTKGFLQPRTDLTSNISAPAQGLQTYITSSATEGIWYYNSGSYQGWTRVLNTTGSQAISGSLTVVGTSNLGGATFSNGGATFTNNVNLGTITEGGAGNSWINLNGTRVHIGQNGSSAGLNVVSATQYVGIGKDTPSTTLDISGSVLVTGSAGTGSALTVYKSGSTVVDIRGSSGQLFSVTDSLSGSLFSVNTVAGLPVVEAFSDNTVNIGKYGTYPIKVVSLGTLASITGSFTGSFYGNGGGLTNISASSIVGLSLSQIATGSVSASVLTGTGSFTVSSGSSNFLFISSSGNVGIGTSTPAYPLSVQGMSNFNTNTSSTNSILRLTDANNGTAWVGFSSTANTGFFIGSNGGMTIGKVTADNSNPSTSHSKIILNEGGNAGIQFSTNVANTGIVFSDGVNATIRMNFPSSNEAAITTISTQNLSIGVASSVGSLTSTTMKFFQSTGDISIGSTTDSARLLVKGAGTTSSTTTLIVQNANASSSLFVRDGTSLGGNNNSSNIKVITDINDFYGNYVYPNLTGRLYSLGVGGSLAIGASGAQSYSSSFLDFNVGYYDNGQGAQSPRAGFITATGTKPHGEALDGRLILGTYRYQYGNAITQSSTLFVYSGSVGINQSSPSNTLDVSGSGRFTNGLVVTGSQVVTDSVTATSFTGSLFGTSSWASNALTASYALNAGDSVWTGSAGNIYYLGGNVGIGTSFASYTLDVSGSARFTNTIYTNFAVASATTAILARGFTDSNFQLVTQNGASVSGYGISTTFGLIYSGTGDVAKINFHRGSGAGTGHISISSPLKIGDTSATAPTAQVTVQGTGTTSSTKALVVQDSAGSAILQTYDNGYISVRQGTGINLGGTANTWDNIQSIASGALTLNPYWGVKVNGGYPAGYDQVSNPLLYVTRALTGPLSALVKFEDSGSTRFIITNSGSVGIGTATPAYLLEVVGTGTLFSIKNSSNSYSFSFNPSYATSVYGGYITHSTGNITLGASIGTDNGSTIGLYLGGPSGDRTAKLQVRGDGSTSATTSLLVQNSAGTTITSVLDDGRLSNYGDFYLGTSSGGGASIFQNSGNTLNLTADNNHDVTLTQIKARRVPAGGGIRIENTNSPSNPDSSAQLDVVSTTKGLLPPRTDLTSNISSPAQGLVTYLTGSTNEGLYYYSSGSIKSWTRVLNNTGSQVIGTGSLSINTNTTSSALNIYKSGSTVVDIQGSQGQLFSVVDTLSGSLMSVNDISGLPILEVFSDDRVVMGTYGNAALVVTGSDTQISASLFGTRQTGSLPIGSTLVYAINTGSYAAGFFDYYVSSGSNYRAGNIMSVWGAGSIRYTDMATPDIGSTIGLQFSMSLSGATAQLFATATSAGWTVKTTFRTI